LNDSQIFGLYIPLVQNRIGEDEIELCLQNGITPLKIDSFERVAVVRAISTWVENAIFLDITTITSLDYFRYAVKARLALVFKGVKNVADMPKRVRTQVLFVASSLDKDEEILRNVDDYASQFEAMEDPSDPTRINIACPSPVVPGLHRICARFDLVF
jgi:phage tail sheath gpL-like